MDITEALARAKSWRTNPRMRPEPGAARLVAATLAERIDLLESQMVPLQRLVVGREVLILRGNPDRGPETGPGFGRKIPAIIEEMPVGVWQVRCWLLVDDPNAVGVPCRAGDSGLWSVSQLVFDQGLLAGENRNGNAGI